MCSTHCSQYAVSQETYIHCIARNTRDKILVFGPYLMVSKSWFSGFSSKSHQKRLRAWRALGLVSFRCSPHLFGTEKQGSMY